MFPCVERLNFQESVSSIPGEIEFPKDSFFCVKRLNFSRKQFPGCEEIEFSELCSLCRKIEDFKSLVLCKEFGFFKKVVSGCGKTEFFKNELRDKNPFTWLGRDNCTSFSFHATSISLKSAIERWKNSGREDLDRNLM